MRNGGTSTALPALPPTVTRTLQCRVCLAELEVLDIDLTGDGSPYIDPAAYVCGGCLENDPTALNEWKRWLEKPAYNELPRTY